MRRRALLGLMASAPLHSAQKKEIRHRNAAPLDGCPTRVAGTLGGRLWISAGSGESAMTPAESALYLGVPNLIFTGPIQTNLDRQLALSVSGLSQVVWPATDLDLPSSSVRPLLAEFPNVTGILLNMAASTDSRRIQDITGRRDIWVHVHQMPGDWLQADDARMQIATVVVLWPEAGESESALARLEKQGLAAGVALGCSIEGNPPTGVLQRQCELALKWMREGRIGGLVFGAGPDIGVDSTAIDWARRWISAARGQLL